jgi:hypothetical protein
LGNHTPERSSTTADNVPVWKPALRFTTLKRESVAAGEESLMEVGQMGGAAVEGAGAAQVPRHNPPAFPVFAFFFTFFERISENPRIHL